MSKPSEQLLQKLIDNKVIGGHGKIFFEMQGSRCQVIDNSIVGNVIQGWLKSFMNDNGILYRVNNNTQEFPDFFLHNERDDIDLLEVKCFTKSANFDVANFLSYCYSLVEKPYRLNNDYLIFEYVPTEDGSVMVKNIWLKKMWEICGASKVASLRLQIKKGQIYNVPMSQLLVKKSLTINFYNIC